MIKGVIRSRCTAAPIGPVGSFSRYIINSANQVLIGGGPPSSSTGSGYRGIGLRGPGFEYTSEGFNTTFKLPAPFVIGVRDYTLFTAYSLNVAAATDYVYIAGTNLTYLALATRHATGSNNASIAFPGGSIVSMGATASTVGYHSLVAARRAGTTYFYVDGVPTGSSGSLNGDVGTVTDIVINTYKTAASAYGAQQDNYVTGLDTAGWTDQRAWLFHSNPWREFYVLRRLYSIPTTTAATHTATASLNAAVQEAKAATASISAAVQVQSAATASISSAVQVAHSASAELSAAIQAAIAATADLDAAVQSPFSATAALDAAVVDAMSAAVNLSAVIQATGTRSASLNAAVQAAQSATASLNAYVLAGTVIVAELDAAIQEAKSAAASLDAAVLLTLTATISLDAHVLSVAGTATASLSAAVQRAWSSAASLNAYILDLEAAVYADNANSIRIGRRARPKQEDMKARTAQTAARRRYN